MPVSPLLQAQLRQPYDPSEWQTLLIDLLPASVLKLWASPQALNLSHEKVESLIQFGELQLSDGKNVALLEVKLTDQVRLARNRVELRNFVAGFIDEAGTAAVLAVFHQECTHDWRLSYVSRQTVLDDSFQVSTIETATKRYTFLMGPDEPSRTSSARLASLGEKGEDLDLKSLAEAFSVEKLSKEFFDHYTAHYKGLIRHLFSPDQAEDTRARFGLPNEDEDWEKGPANKPVRDFVKKLLGRLVFLQFLQKKGWLGCPADTTEWTGGQMNFLQRLYQQAEEANAAETFHSTYLTQLFFEALNTERTDDLFALTGTRVPYLNGGLFDPDPQTLQQIDFPGHQFKELLEFFGQYNFTIDENDTDDHEVGIDPEMLGHIFENLLEDNKDKGAYYTPKSIVSYMCQQSLLHYLQTHLGIHEELAKLIKDSDPGDLKAKGNWCAAHAKKIATLLTNVKICDPAIGSGAFPIGMLNEIARIRTLLNAELNDPVERAKLKKSIIQKSIYGVDLDLGAVEIARLRFWLALVVDEVTPQPLPNLDYKIMQGNSLLESFQGVDLSNILDENAGPEHTLVSLVTQQGELDLQSSGQQELRIKTSEKRSELLEARRAYFAARKPTRKNELRQVIDAKVIEHIRHHIEYQLECEEIQEHRLSTEWQRKRAQTNGAWKPAKAAQKRYDALIVHIKTLKDSLSKLDGLQSQAERPFFLWHLLFEDAFKEGGFDIVIANPPYVRHELIKEQKPLLKAEGYTTYAGTADLFVYFYEQASNLLKQGGILTFITSSQYYRAGYGKKLRTFLTGNHTLHTLIDFRDAPVFNGVTAFASIFIGQKETAPADHAVAALPWDPKKKAENLASEIAKAFSVAQASLTEDGWRLVSPNVNALLTKLRQKGTPLGEYVDGRFYRGILTGFNEAFVINGKTRADLIAADPKSEDIIKPFLRGRNVKRWRATQDDTWLIFTRRGTDIEDFPAIKSHLSRYRKQLEPKPDDWPSNKKWNGRKGGSYQWFEIQDNIAYWKEFEEPKIVYPELDARNQFAPSSRGTYADCTCYIIPNAEKHFLALLNSDYCLFYMDKNAAKNRGGAIRWKHQYIQHIPIPHASTVDQATLNILAEKCALAAVKDDRASLAGLETEINQIIYRLFDLTDAEITLIESTLGIEAPVPLTVAATPILPTGARPAAHGTARLYLLDLLPHFFRASGEAISFRQLFEGYHLLCNLGDARAGLTPIETKWADTFQEPVDLAEFVNVFRESVSGEDLEITAQGLIRWIGDSVEDNAWMECDARMVMEILQRAPAQLAEVSTFTRKTILEPVFSAYPQLAQA